MKFGRAGFSIIEILVATALLAGLATLVMTISLHHAQLSRSLKVSGGRDLTYQQIGRFASDPSVVRQSFTAGQATQSTLRINKCLATCLDSTVPDDGCGSSGANRCVARGVGGPAQYPLTIYSPVDVSGYSGKPTISGPNSANYPSIPDSTVWPPAAYGVDGSLQLDPAALPQSRPILAETWFTPLCPENAASCTQASAIQVSFRVRWDPNVISPVSQGYTELSGGPFVISACRIQGFSVCQPSWTTQTNTSTTTSTGTGTGTSTGTGSGTGTGTGSGTGTGTGTSTSTSTSTNTGPCSICLQYATCLAGETPIDTPSGKRSIRSLYEQFQVGMTVQVKSLEFGSSSQSGVHPIDRDAEVVTRRTVRGYYKIHTQSGRELKITAEHPVFVVRSADDLKNGIYVKVSELRERDVLVSKTKKGLRPDAIISIQFVNQEIEVFNLHVRGVEKYEDQNYFANGILVHNKSLYCLVCME